MKEEIRGAAGSDTVNDEIVRQKEIHPKAENQDQTSKLLSCPPDNRITYESQPEQE